MTKYKCLVAMNVIMSDSELIPTSSVFCMFCIGNLVVGLHVCITPHMCSKYLSNIQQK